MLLKKQTNQSIKLLIVLLLLIVMDISAKAPILTPRELSSPPPRIIRTCCSFGAELRIAAIPMKTVTDITSLEKIGDHCYLGNKTEGNGIIYTGRGGFIDLGHVRDCADWTAYLYSIILTKAETGGKIVQRLGNEGGAKVLTLKIPAGIANMDAALLAGRIAYDLSVWHEIATWFGASYIPMVPEAYSSFSAEDLYSNLLGVTLAIKAIQSDLPYEEAMTRLLAQTLKEMAAVQTEDETLAAMEAVENIWWTRDERLPSRDVLLQRNLTAYSCLSPWLVPKFESGQPVVELYIPYLSQYGRPLSTYYELGFHPNFKFPFKEMFPARVERHLTQKDFDILIGKISNELAISNRASLREGHKRSRGW